MAISQTEDMCNPYGFAVGYWLHGAQVATLQIFGRLAAFDQLISVAQLIGTTQARF